MFAITNRNPSAIKGYTKALIDGTVGIPTETICSQPQILRDEKFRQGLIEVNDKFKFIK